MIDGRLIDLRPEHYEAGERVAALGRDGPIQFVTLHLGTLRAFGQRSASVLIARGQPLGGRAAPVTLVEGVTVLRRVVGPAPPPPVRDAAARPDRAA